MAGMVESANGTINVRRHRCPARCSWSPRRSAISKTSRLGRCASSATSSLIAAEDTRRTAHLLARYAITTPTTSLHEHNEMRKTPSLIARLRRARASRSCPMPGRRRLRSWPTSNPCGDRRRNPRRVDSRTERDPDGARGVWVRRRSHFTFLGFPPTRSKDRKRGFGDLAVCRGNRHLLRGAAQDPANSGGDSRHQVGDRAIVVARELTKVHEELVRGPISVVLLGPYRATGELTIVVDLGHKTDTRTTDRCAGRTCWPF